MNKPLPLDPLTLFIKLEAGTHLVASIAWANQTLQERYFILRVVPCTILSNTLPSIEDNIPKAFVRAVSLVEIGVEKALTQLTGALPGNWLPWLLVILVNVDFFRFSEKKFC